MERPYEHLPDKDLHKQLEYYRELQPSWLVDKALVAKLMGEMLFRKWASLNDPAEFGETDE